MILSRGLGDVAVVDPDTARLRRAVRAWNGRTFTAAQVLPVLSEALDMARVNQYRVTWTGELPDELVEGTGLRTSAGQQLRQLEYLHALMSKQAGDPFQFSSSHKTWQDVKNAVLAPIMWQGTAAAVGQVLDGAQEQLYEETVTRILNLPGEVVAAVVAAAADIIEKGVKAALPKGFEIPGWVAPVLVGGVALGAAAWLYSTFRRFTP